MPPPGRGAIIGPPPIIGRPPKPPMPNAAAECDPATQQAISSKLPSKSARIDRERIALFRMANSRCGAAPSFGHGDEAYDLIVLQRIDDARQVRLGKLGWRDPHPV